MNGPNVDLILMSTLACNMACKYCYVTEKQPDVMDLGLARRAIEQVMEHNDSARATNIFWHGAEPLLAGIDYYREICAWTRERYGLDKVSHHIQTNGVILNADWYDLFIHEHITAGVSLDGPRHIHDANRMMEGGKGTFDQVYGNIRAAREKQLYLDALVVITRATLGHEDEIFDFFYANRIEFGFEPVVVGVEWGETDFAITPREYADSAIHLFDRWLDQPEPRLKTVIPLYDFAMAVMSGDNTRCTFSRSCGQHYLAIAPDGSVFPCVRFCGADDFVLGHLVHDSVDDILNSARRKAFVQPRTDAIARCAKCRWGALCNSGCPQHAYAVRGSIYEPDPFCVSYQRIFDHVSQRLQGLLHQQGLRGR